MTLTQKDKLLRFALTAFGLIFCLIYPVGMIWPSGWVWHGGHGQYYLQMICGAYAVLGIFLIAGAQELSDGHDLGHLPGDVPARVLVAAVLSSLTPSSRQQRAIAEQSGVVFN